MTVKVRPEVCAFIDKKIQEIKEKQEQPSKVTYQAVLEGLLEYWMSIDAKHN